MAYTEITFGKHEGKILPQVLFSDPDYFFWAFEKGVFKDKGSLAEEASEIHHQATRIRIPHDGAEELLAEYIIHPGTRKFVGMNIVPSSRTGHAGSPAFRRAVIDLSAVRQIAKYDKCGGRLLLTQVKQYVFSDPKQRMTRERCEQFFEDAGNFVP